MNGWQMTKAGLLTVAVGGYRETREGARMTKVIMD